MALVMGKIDILFYFGEGGGGSLIVAKGKCQILDLN